MALQERYNEGLLVRKYDPIYRRNRADMIVSKTFPIVAAIGLIVSAAVAWSSGIHTLGVLMMCMCQVYLLIIIAYGVIGVIYSDRGIIPFREYGPLMLVMPLVVGTALYLAGVFIYPDMFESRLFPRLGSPTLNVIATVVELYFLELFTIVAIHGLLSIVVGYFRKYSAKLYLWMEKLRNDGTDPMSGKIALKIYRVPSVIDIKSIDLEPPSASEGSVMEELGSMSISIFTIGLLMCSYIFLNPLFVGEMTLGSLVIVAVMLSIFMPAIIIPWYLARDIGATVKSQARDYPLWVGLRSTLYSVFSTIFIFILLIALLVYLGTDFLTVTLAYLGFVMFLGFASVLFAFVYINNYYMGFRDTVMAKYSDAKNMK